MTLWERKPAIDPLTYVHVYENNGIKSFEYDPKIGTLYVAMSQHSLDKLIKESKLTEEGTDIFLPMPFSSKYNVKLPKVKSIDFLKRNDNECHWNPTIKVPVEPEPIAPVVIAPYKAPEPIFEPIPQKKSWLDVIYKVFK